MASLNIVVSEKLADRAAKTEILFRELLIHPSIKEIRGLGLLLAVELGSSEKVQQFIRKGLENGIVSDWFIFHDTAFRIAPPLNISDDEVHIACRLVLKTLDDIS